MSLLDPLFGGLTAASSLATTASPVLVADSLPPTTGQVLTAISPTEARWETPDAPPIGQLPLNTTVITADATIQLNQVSLVSFVDVDDVTLTIPVGTENARFAVKIAPSDGDLAFCILEPSGSDSIEQIDDSDSLDTSTQFRLAGSSVQYMFDVDANAWRLEQYQRGTGTSETQFPRDTASAVGNVEDGWTTVTGSASDVGSLLVGQPNSEAQWLDKGTTGQVLTVDVEPGLVWQTPSVAVGGVTGLGAGVATFLATPSSANLAAAVTGESGTGALVFANSPSLISPALGVPSAATLTNATGLPISTGVAGLGTGVATFLATPTSANLAAAVSNETGSGNLVFATSPTLVSPILGTPTSANLTNATSLPISTGVSGLGTGVATFLATPSSANLSTAMTDKTGTGLVVLATSPSLVTPNIGTPSAGVLTNCTGRVNASQTADRIATSGTAVTISSTSPTAGQELVAVSSTAAIWQTMALCSSADQTAIGTGGSAITGFPIALAAGTWAVEMVGWYWGSAGSGLGVAATFSGTATTTLLLYDVMKSDGTSTLTGEVTALSTRAGTSSDTPPDKNGKRGFRFVLRIVISVAGNLTLTASSATGTCSINSGNLVRVNLIG